MASEVAWAEVVGKDGEKLKSFYSELFGWQVQQAPGGMPYWMHSPEGTVGAGIGQSQDGKGHVTFYVGVDDTYRFRFRRAQAEKAPATAGAHPAWHGLQTKDTWQDDYFTGAKARELRFWLGQPEPAGPS